jgi:hypothetical protein
MRANYSGAEVVLERRLRLPKRWWEADGAGAAETIGGPAPGRSPVDNADSDDDGDIAAMDKSSTGVIEVYVITAGVTARAEAGHSSGEQRQTRGECHSDSSDSSDDDDMSLFS